jgi:hypothetical protein
MGGGVSFEMLNELGQAFRVFGKFTGSKNETTAFVQVKGDPGGLPDGVYEVDTSQLSNVLATIDIDFLQEKGIEVPGIRDTDATVTPSASVVTGDTAMSKIREDGFNLAKSEGRFPLLNNDDIDVVVGNQYKGLFEDFKAQNPEFADKFANADEYWNYVKGGGVSTTTKWVEQDKLNPVLQASNKLYAEQVLGIPDDGYIEVYRNAINHKDTQELSAAGYASLDRDMAWDYASDKGLKNGLDGRYVIRVKPEEVQGVLGYSQAHDEFAVVIGPDITSIPGRITRVGDTEVVPMTSYIDHPELFDRNTGATPHRHFSVASQYEFTPLKEEFMKGNNWSEFTEMQQIPRGALTAKMDELYGAGTFLEGKTALGGNVPQFSLFKDMFVELPGGEWGLDPMKLENLRRQFGGKDDNGKFDFMMKMLTSLQDITGNWFMEPGTGF